MLARFIASHIETIVDECEAFARTLLPAAANMDSEALRDHVAQILAVIAADMGESQTPREQIQKSRGLAPHDIDAPETAAETHGGLRAASGFNVSQTAAEYRALRATIIRLWLATGPQLGAAEIDELIRFNEAMDQALAESIFYFAKSAARDRNLFLGVLSHELRTPLATITASAHVIQKVEPATAPIRDSANRILRGSKRIESVLNDLLEFVRSGAGGGMRVTPSSLLADELCTRIAREVEVALPGASVRTELIGNMSAVWDAQRVAQAVSNLTTNAIKYGTPGTPVSLTVDGSAEDRIAISVRNSGEPIPAAVRESLFEPLVRGTGPDRAGYSLGLGLYIVREIARAHGGEVGVASPDPGTTVFTMTLPRLTDPSTRTAFGVLGRQSA